MSKRVPIHDLVTDPQQSQQQKELFKEILRLRQFSTESLLLPENGSYSRFVELEHDYVVWNVFATPKFSLQPISSCFLVVGCLQYKGFFAEQDALDFAAELRKDDNDVYVGGVSAYSTLGWFDDPILSSMLKYGELRLAEVIFHELAHQLIYIKNDSAFNEAFATAVGNVGVQRWLEKNDRDIELVQFEKSNRWEQSFLQLVLASKQELEALYARDIAPKEMLRIKHDIYTALKNNYLELKQGWDNPPNYDKWMSHDLNNAKIASVVTYHDLAGAFMELLKLSENDLELFYKRVRFLGDLPKEQRHTCLENLSIRPHCYRQD